jgi:hypothetical protein
MKEDQPIRHDIRFCPYCFQMSFDLAEVTGPSVYCEICGVDINVEELEKQQ